MDIGRLGQELMKGKRAEAFKELAESERGRRATAAIDMEKLEQAAQRGDTAALGAMLQRLLSTKEGRDFAADVKRLVEN